jgi:hypothetical protein
VDGGNAELEVVEIVEAKGLALEDLALETSNPRPS